MEQTIHQYGLRSLHSPEANCNIQSRGIDRMGLRRMVSHPPWSALWQAAAQPHDPARILHETHPARAPFGGRWVGPAARWLQVSNMVRVFSGSLGDPRYIWTGDEAHEAGSTVGQPPSAYSRPQFPIPIPNSEP